MGRDATSDVEIVREALAKIAEIAATATRSLAAAGGRPGERPTGDVPGCSIRALPNQLQVDAARFAVRSNPANAIQRVPIGDGASFAISDPMQIAVLTQKYWGPAPRQLTVSFTEPAQSDLKQRILSHMNAWSTRCCISFVLTNGSGDVRISREGSGYWSYLGTDIKFVPANRPTMNLQGFTMATPESEYRRVVRHETGHTLGFPHEHMRAEIIERIDPRRAYAYFWKTQGWDRAMVDAQVLTPLGPDSIFAITPADQVSIMCYQLPGSITRDGTPILGGLDIDETDYQFAATIYPKAGQPATVPDVGPTGDVPDWDEFENSESEV